MSRFVKRCTHCGRKLPGREDNTLCISCRTLPEFGEAFSTKLFYGFYLLRLSNGDPEDENSGERPSVLDGT